MHFQDNLLASGYCLKFCTEYQVLIQYGSFPPDAKMGWLINWKIFIVLNSWNADCRMRFKIINHLQVDLISFESIPPSVVHRICTLYNMYRIFIHTKSCENSIQFEINLIPLNMITFVEMKAFSIYLFI